MLSTDEEEDAAREAEVSDDDIPAAVTTSGSSEPRAGEEEELGYADDGFDDPAQTAGVGTGCQESCGFGKPSHFALAPVRAPQAGAWIPTRRLRGPPWAERAEDSTNISDIILDGEGAADAADAADADGGAAAAHAEAAVAEKPAAAAEAAAADGGHPSPNPSPKRAKCA